MAELKLYFADCAGTPSNCSYPHEAVVTDGYLYKRHGFISAAGVKHLLYVPDYIFNHRHKYDTLYISYDEPIRQDAGDHGLKLYDGYKHAVSGALIIDFVDAAEKYSGYDVSDIRRELKRKSDWFDEKYGKEHLHE